MLSLHRVKIHRCYRVGWMEYRLWSVFLTGEVVRRQTSRGGVLRSPRSHSDEHSTDTRPRHRDDGSLGILSVSCLRVRVFTTYCSLAMRESTSKTRRSRSTRLANNELMFMGDPSSWGIRVRGISLHLTNTAGIGSLKVPSWYVLTGILTPPWPSDGERANFFDGRDIYGRCSCPGKRKL